MIKRMVIMLVAVAVVFGGIFGFQAFKAAMIKKFITALSNPPQTISATTAATSEWQPKIEAVGSLRAVRGADLSLEVLGVVEFISFNSGDDVQEGAQLLKLRTADDVARLELLKAMAELNEITLDRAQRLLKTQAVSQAQLDSEKSTAARTAVFACIECGLVCAYLAQDVQRGPLQTRDLHSWGILSLAYIEPQCTGKNCKAPRRLYVLASGPAAGGDLQMTVRPRDWQFSPTATCEAGHVLVFREDA